uniref:Uncharacterized protein n=1 Tax=Acrobeloides nanus TaxID=290746 RepID=A0A914DUW8_9BILA
MKILIIIISTVLIQFAYGLTQAERDAVVQVHNNYRSQLSKGQTILQNSNNAQSAKNMYKIVRATSYYSNDPSNAMDSTSCETSTTTTSTVTPSTATPSTATPSTTTTSASTVTTSASTATPSTTTTSASTATTSTTVTSTSAPQCASCTANLPTLITGSVTPYIYMNPTFVPDAGNPNSGNCRAGIMCNGTNLSLIINGTVNGNTSQFGYHNNGNNVTIELDCWNYTTTWYFLNNAQASVNSVSCQVNAADFAPQTQLMINAPRSAQNDVVLVQVASAKKEYGYKKVPKAKKSAMEATNANTNIKQK